MNSSTKSCPFESKSNVTALVNIHLESSPNSISISILIKVLTITVFHTDKYNSMPNNYHIKIRIDLRYFFNIIFWTNNFTLVNNWTNLLSDSGTDIMTPFPVPIHSLFEEISNAVIRTKENPSFPVPATNINIHLLLRNNKYWILLMLIFG